MILKEIYNLKLGIPPTNRRRDIMAKWKMLIEKKNNKRYKKQNSAENETEREKEGGDRDNFKYVIF